MKFISKNGNLMVVLRPGLPAQPVTGTPPTPTIFVRFVNGVAEVNDEKLVEMMHNHPGFNADFISAGEVAVDPYAHRREETEPVHIIQEMMYGHPGKRTVSQTKPKLPPELMKMITDQAQEIAKQMLPGMVKETLKAMVQDRQNAHEENASTDTSPEMSTTDPVSASATNEAPKKSAGRPKKDAVK